MVISRRLGRPSVKTRPVRPTTVRITDLDHKRLRVIAAHLGVAQGDVISVLLAEKAAQMGVEIDAPAE